MDLLLALTVVGAVVVALSTRAKIFGLAANLVLLGIALLHTDFRAMTRKVKFVAQLQRQPGEDFMTGVTAMADELEAARVCVLIVVAALTVLACRPLAGAGRGGT